MIEKAIMLAAEMHEGQKDKSGKPYIYHPLAVMMKVKSKTAKIVAVLHDTVEDTNLELMDLKDAGYSEKVIEAVDAITKVPGESYMDYLTRVKANKIALEVKLADLSHNMSPSRMAHLDSKSFERLVKKYLQAIRYLSGKV